MPIDSMMGSGKTSWALQHINDDPKTSFVFITPFLSEIDRVVAKTNGRFKAPVNRGKLSGRGYTKAFLPCNCRSVNEYADRRCLAYCLNVFVNPIILNYFLYYNVYLNEDSYALTEMLQWIWRSGIRNGESINIYIPSARMRNLLEIWINKYKAL